MVVLKYRKGLGRLLNGVGAIFQFSSISGFSGEIHRSRQVKCEAPVRRVESDGDGDGDGDSDDDDDNNNG